MPRIELYNPVGGEATRATGIAPFPELGGSKIAFLFNGHVSVLPFWKNLEEEIKTRFEPSDTITVIKPNTFSPAGSSTIEDLSDVDLPWWVFPLEARALPAPCETVLTWRTRESRPWSFPTTFSGKPPRPSRSPWVCQNCGSSYMTSRRGNPTM